MVIHLHDLVGIIRAAIDHDGRWLRAHVIQLAAREARRGHRDEADALRRAIDAPPAPPIPACDYVVARPATSHRRPT